MPIPNPPRKPQVTNRHNLATSQINLIFKFDQSAETEAPGAPVQPPAFAQPQGQLPPANLMYQFNQNGPN
ncbi:MAG: hypothetical protein CMF51_02705 [Legionellales bacterium]|nr:hypothetical protein [Legionellales bacterium]|tara:strand:- start:1129 stop:1338 length:210 start_codon:yes stop_codon:yes gene_type:complete